MNAHFLYSLPGVLLSLTLAPLLYGVINRVKAHMAGRTGRPLLQSYYDLAKLLRKAPVYSRTTTWIFQAGPLANLAACFCALLIVPFGDFPSVLAFSGDFILLTGLLALGRFGLVLAALDTGSAFEGMGASREALFSAMAEPVLLLCFAVLAQAAGQTSLSAMLWFVAPDTWSADRPLFLLLIVAFFLLLLVENCRIPADDPNTHLELTMIHEVMVLDHSGPDLAFVEYAAALKLWIFCLLTAGIAIPAFFDPLYAAVGMPAASGPAALVLNGLGTLLAVFATAVCIGLVESLMARLRLERVPQLLTLAAAFAGLAALVLWR